MKQTVQATFADGIILPLAEQHLNASLRCYGYREATNLAEAECILGFPSGDLDRIVAELGELAAKAMPCVRGKAVYHALLGRNS